jgi:hypothetical protein
MVYGCPTLNLSQVSGTEYNVQQTAVATWTVAEIFVGPLVFVSPSHVRLKVNLNGRSGGATDLIEDNLSYSSNLVGFCKNSGSSPIINYIGNNSPGTGDYYITHVLDADFTAITGDNRVDYIDITCLVIVDGYGIPGTSIAETFDIGPNDTVIPYRLYIEWIESAFVVVGKNNTPGRISNYAQHCCLPPSPVAGQTHRIKNGSYGTTGIYVFIHAIEKQIDNKNSNLFFSTSYTSTDYINGTKTYPFSENGFVLPPLHACMLVYDGTKWLIQEYFNATRDAYSYDWAPSTPPNTCPIATQPIVLCNVTASKYIQLPNPAGSLKLLRIIAYTTEENMTNVVRIYPFPGARLEDNADNSMFFREYNGAGSACMTLISDGVQWWVANIYDGYNSFYTTQTGRPISTNPITVIRNTGDGAGLSPVTLPAGIALEKFIKMDKISSSNGIVINTSDSATAFIGSGTFNCVLAGSPLKNYTATSVIGMFNGNNTVYFVTSYFSGY